MNAKEAKQKMTAFTLTELLVVIGFLAFLALLFLPAYGDSRTKSRGVRCLDNLRQVMNGALMYTHDYHDLFPPNPDDANTPPGYNWALGIVSGGMPDNPPPPPGASTFNTDVSADSNKWLLLSYVGGDSSVFRCTADPRHGLYSGSDSNKFGTVVPAIRSVSMSGAVGTVDQSWLSTGHHSGQPSVPVNGAWLTGTHGGNSHNNPWRTYGSLADMVIPIPAKISVFIEEDPYSINDGYFAFSAGQAQWLAYPTTRHNMAGGLSFADGHSELHKWQNVAMRLTATHWLDPLPPNDPDWLWLQSRTSVRAQ